MLSSRASHRRRGASALESLVLMLLMAGVFAILVPATHEMNNLAKRMDRVPNLQQISLGMHNYHEDILATSRAFLQSLAVSSRQGTINFDQLLLFALQFEGHVVDLDALLADIAQLKGQTRNAAELRLLNEAQQKVQKVRNSLVNLSRLIRLVVDTLRLARAPLPGAATLDSLAGLNVKRT